MVDPVSDPAVTPMPDMWVSLLNGFGMFCVVLGLLVGFLWLLRRFYHRGGGGQEGLIRVLATSYLAPKERIVLVDVLGEKLLLGITSQHINLLARIADEDDICGAPPEAPESLFKSLLRRKIKGMARNRDKGDKEPSAG